MSLTRDLIRPARRQVLNQVWGRGDRARSGRARPERPFGPRRQPPLAHEARHPVFAAPDARGAQGPRHPRAAIAAFVRLKDFPNALPQNPIGLGTLTHFVFLPLVVAAAAHLQGLTAVLDAEFHRKLLDHRIPGFGSSPTMLIAFFRMARCCSRYCTCLRKARFSRSISAALMVRPSTWIGAACAT